MAVLHAGITVFFAVVITANHWWLDGIIAATLLALALLAFPRPQPPRCYGAIGPGHRGR